MVAGEVSVDMQKVHDYVHGCVSHVYEHDDHPDLLRKQGTDVFPETRAVFLDPHTVRLHESRQESSARPHTLSARNFLLCTGAKVGAKPAPLPLRSTLLAAIAAWHG